MNTISYRKILEFVRLHPAAESSLSSWYKIAKKASWQNIVDIRKDYPHADLVGRFVVFNIAGNNYRLIAEIHFESQLVLIRHILTHADYDKGKWKQ
jgi:mRNA interferase HigB